MAVIGGFLFGYDTAVVSSAMLYIPDANGMKKMSVVWKQLIVSITPGMAALGALLAAPSSDYFGRRKVILLSSAVFTVGGIVCAAAPEKITLFVGRMLLGFAIGFASMIVPVYVGETSPAYMRGFLLTGFQLMICFGEMSASLISGAFSYIDPLKVGWRLMVGFAAIPSFLQLVGFLFLPESPRFLYEIGEDKATEQVLNKIYKGDEKWVEFELSEISRVCKEEKEAKAKVKNEFVFLRMLQTPHVRRALIIGCLLQMFQQLCGINAIMYYTGTIIKAAGIEDKHTSIWLSSAVAGVFFFGTFVPLFLIEKIGRRLLLLVSVAGVDLALFFIAVAFLLVNKDSDGTNTNYTVAGDLSISSKCFTHSNCDYCVTDDDCGYCFQDSSSVGLCLPVDKDNSDYSTIGECSATSQNYTFHADYCKTKYTSMPIVAMVVYIFFFAIGFAPLAWALNAEFHPLWARSTGCACSTFTNWLFSLIISMTFLSLGMAITKYGVFFLYGGITFIAFFFILVYIPETTGIGIEDVELLFMDKKTRQRLLDGKLNEEEKTKF